jgi:hypothetical protein
MTSRSATRSQAKGVCVLEYTYRDVMDDFDRVAQEIKVALSGGEGDTSLDLASLPGWSLLDEDATTKQAVVSVNAAAWLMSESAWVESLRSGNQAASRVGDYDVMPEFYLSPVR